MSDRRSVGKTIRPWCVSATFGLGILLGAVVLGHSTPLVVGLSVVCAVWLFHTLYWGQTKVFTKVINIFKNGS